MLNTVSLDNTLGSFSLGDSHDVHVLILLEDTVDGDFLFEKTGGEINLLGDISSVDLDFHDVVLLLSEVQLVHLGGGNHSNNGGVLSDSVEFDIDGFVLFVLMLLGVFGESFLLAAHPVLVESSKSVLVQLLGPDSGQSSKSSGSINVPDDSYHSHGGSFDDSHSLNDFLLVQLGSCSVNFSQDVGHSCLESGEGSQVTGLGRVILGEMSDSTSESFGSSSG